MEAFLQRARFDGEAIRQSGTAELLASRKELAQICLLAGETTLAVQEDSLSTFQ